MPVNEYSAEIVDISVSRSRSKQVAKAFEESRGIVLGKKRRGIESEVARPRKRGVINKSAGRIIGAAAAAVGAVGIAGNCRDSRRGPKRLGERQSVFLVRTAASLAAKGYGEFAARHNDPAPPLCLQVSGKLRLGRRNLAGFALDPVAEKYAVIAAGSYRRLGGAKGFLRTGDEAERRTVEGVVLGLRRFVGRIGQCAADGLGNVQPEPRHHGAGIRKRGRVRYRGSRTDHRRVVAGNVGDGERHHPRRKGQPAEPSALDARQMLAHRVDLTDRSSRFKQRAVHRLLFGKRQAGSWSNPVRRCATR